MLFPFMVVAPDVDKSVNVTTPENVIFSLEIVVLPALSWIVEDVDPLDTLNVMLSTYCSIVEMSPWAFRIWVCRLLAVCSRLEMSPLIPVICVVILETVCWIVETCPLRPVIWLVMLFI